MKLVTYLGPSDRRRIRTSKKTVLLVRGDPTELSNELAKVAQRRCGSRVTVTDVKATTSQREGASPPEKGTTNVS